MYSNGAGSWYGSGFNQGGAGGAGQSYGGFGGGGGSGGTNGAGGGGGYNGGSSNAWSYNGTGGSSYDAAGTGQSSSVSVSGAGSVYIVSNIQQIPSAPTGVSAVASGSGALAASWSPSTNSPSYYTATAYATTGFAVASCTTSSTSCTITGLTNGSSYAVEVTATNSVGTSPASSPTAFITLPAGVPSAPAAPTGTAASGADTLSWSAPANGGYPITGYTVTSSPGGYTCTTTGATSCTVTGLTNGISYTFTVAATNSAGTGPASPASAPITYYTVPAAPTNVTGSAGDTTVAVSWTAPSNTGGYPITLYTATSSPGGFTCTSNSATTCTVTGLTDGTSYTFTVTATNSLGTGPASSPSAGVTPAAPLYAFSVGTSFTFTSCTVTGQTGPSLAQCQSSYSATSWTQNTSYFNDTAGVQYWTVPASGCYQFTVAGAPGAAQSQVAGSGALVRATLCLTSGQVIKILVGQAGGSSTSGGGGGGTFVVNSSNSPLLVAGGGAGAVNNTVSGILGVLDGQTTTNGANAYDGSGAGGNNGGGGTGSSSGWGGGAGGFSGNGTNAANCANTLGYAFLNGAAGGASCATSAVGGFGGGAGTHGNTGGGGGGGGYSGGGGSSQNNPDGGGGGGSYVVSTATGLATSNGYYAGSTVFGGSSIGNIGTYNGATNGTLVQGYVTVQRTS